MFQGATAFNQDISGWITSNVTTMSCMFRDAIVFNQDISSWDTSKVTDMSYMFLGSSKFNNKDNTLQTTTNGWNTSNVTIMTGMFFNAMIFNQDISSWNTLIVTDMSLMFGGAIGFNNGGNPLIQKSGGWNTSKVTNMSVMFQMSLDNTPSKIYGNFINFASIGNWDFSKIISTTNNNKNFYDFIQQTCNNQNTYDNFLINLSKNTTVNSNLNLGNTGMIHSNIPEVNLAFNILTKNKKMIIIESYPFPISNICFPANTPIKTDQGIINIDKINIEIHTIRNEKIINITQTVSQDNYLICFNKNSLGLNYPNNKTIMTPNHKIYYKGQMIQAKQFINRFNNNITKIKYNGEILYNILMHKYNKININNLIVETLHPKNIIAKLYTNNYNEDMINKIIFIMNNSIKKKDFYSYKKITSRFF